MAENSIDRNDDNIDELSMSFGDHLMELRSRMIKVLLGLVVGFAVCLCFGGEIFGFIATPLMVSLKHAGYPPTLSVLAPQEPFLIYMKVCLLGGVVISSPWWFYQLWGFISAGLHDNEKRYVNHFVPFSAILFTLGVMFFIFIVAPISFTFFIRFSEGWTALDISDNTFYSRLLGATDGGGAADDEDDKNIDPKADGSGSDESPKEMVPSRMEFKYKDFTVSFEIPVNDYRKPEVVSDNKPAGSEKTDHMLNPTYRLKEYVSLVMVMGLAFGIAFQMPLAVFLLGRLGLVALATFCLVRKYVLLGIFVFSAAITPPDPLSMIAMALPMYVLYEVGIIMVKICGNQDRD